MHVITGSADRSNHASGRGEQANPYFLDHLTRQIIAIADPQRIVVFGSRVNGIPRPDSDWDLFVETDLPPHELLGRLRTPLKVDLAIRDSAFVAERRQEGHPVMGAIDQGITLYDRSAHHVQTWPLADGANGTFQALALMASAVRGECGPDYSGFQDIYNFRAATEIIRGYRGSANDPLAALFYFCRDHITYIDHPLNTQQVQDCRRTLERRTGDCVSKSVCLSTLLASQGIHSRFVAQCPDGQDYTHVYVEAWDGERWIGLDPVASGTDNRPLGDVGWRQMLPDGGFESTQEIF